MGTELLSTHADRPPGVGVLGNEVKHQTQQH